MMSTIEKFFVSLLTPYPARDWFIALVLLFLLFLGLVGYAGYIFWDIKTGTVAPENQEVKTALPNVSRGDVGRMLEAYRTRLDNFQKRNF